MYNTHENEVRCLSDASYQIKSYLSLQVAITFEWSPSGVRKADSFVC